MQLIIFRASCKKLPNDFNLVLDTDVIKPLNAVKLPRFTIDRHFTETEHIDAIARSVRVCWESYSRQLPVSRMACIAPIRSHQVISYASAVLASLL